MALGTEQKCCNYMNFDRKGDLSSSKWLLLFLRAKDRYIFDWFEKKGD
jgi:hypothetical protein